MATLTPKNPRLVQSDNPMEKRQVAAAVSQTWKQGQVGYYSSGLATFCDDDATNVKFMFLEDQDTSTTASELVWVGIITSDMIFEGFELDGTVARSNIGVPYALDLTSNVITVDIGDTGNDAVTIVDLGWIYEPSRNTSADVKARLKFRYLTAALDA